MTKFCHIFTPKRTKCSLKYDRGSPRTYKKCTATPYLYFLNMCVYFLKRKFSENVLIQRPEHTKLRNQQTSVEYYTVGEQKRFLSSRKILSIIIMCYWLQCC